LTNQGFIGSESFEEYDFAEEACWNFPQGPKYGTTEVSRKIQWIRNGSIEEFEDSLNTPEAQPLHLGFL
jgi:hypothetical protein